MKIDKKELAKFLKKIKMDGTEGIDEAVFDFTTDGVKISALTPANITRVNAMLYASVFENYEAINKIAIQNISQIIKLLDRFKKMVEITVEGNILRLKEGSKKIETTLVDLQFVSVAPELNAVPEFDDVIKIAASDLNEFIKDALINSEFELILETKPKQLILKSTGKFKFENTYACETAKGGVVVKLGQTFEHVAKNLTGTLELSLKTDYPVKLFEKTESSVITILTAPRVEKPKEDE